MHLNSHLQLPGTSSQENLCKPFKIKHAHLLQLGENLLVPGVQTNVMHILAIATKLFSSSYPVDPEIIRSTFFFFQVWEHQIHFVEHNCDLRIELSLFLLVHLHLILFNVTLNDNARTLVTKVVGGSACTLGIESLLIEEMTLQIISSLEILEVIRNNCSQRKRCHLGVNIP